MIFLGLQALLALYLMVFGRDYGESSQDILRAQMESDSARAYHEFHLVEQVDWKELAKQVRDHQSAESSTEDAVNRKVADVIASWRKPVLINNSPLLKWPAMKQWTQSYLIKNAPQLSDVYTHQNHVFWWEDPTQLMSKVGL